MNSNHEDIWKCDWHGTCKREPYAEVYVVGDSWSYLCKFHYYWDRIRRFFWRRRQNIGYYVLTKEERESKGAYDD